MLTKVVSSKAKQGEGQGNGCKDKAKNQKTPDIVLSRQLMRMELTLHYITFFKK